MRSRKALINTIFSLLEEAVSFICGFILPRLILTSFGSKFNGLTTSITQFLACAVLLRSGIGGATRAALYKPLAEDDQQEFNAIVRATDIYMKKIGAILGASIIIFASIYPFLVRTEFGWFFTFSLFLIIGASTFAESFFGITYLIVLQADQRLWVSSFLKIICHILNTTLGVILIKAGASIHMVKLGSAVVYVVYPVAMGAYVQKKYKIDKKVQPDYKAISQRWDAFWHQVSVFVMNNTDVMILTFFSNMLEVSVYSVYHMVTNGLRRLAYAFSNGLEAPFGNMIAKKEFKTLKENFSVTENIIYGICTIIYTCAAVLILSFVKLYTKNVNDVNYIRPIFAYLTILAGFFSGIRMPYQLVVQAAGHYKQTKIFAIIEPIINIIISIVFVIKYGLVGVAVGSLVAIIFRTIQYSYYMSRHIVIRSQVMTFFRLFVSFCEAGLSITIVHFLHLGVPENYFAWAITGLVSAIVCISVVVSGSFLFFRQDTKNTSAKLRMIFHRKIL